MNDLIAVCGLDCSTCEARIATVNNDDGLREKVAIKWSELNKVTITPEMINCVGCRAEGVKTPFCESLCPIRNCAIGRGYSTCGDCKELDGCRTAAMVHATNSEAKERLKKG
ncbi:MAG: DUF3795 domain-containing protein [Candidatus Coproplasma sp.]